MRTGGRKMIRTSNRSESISLSLQRPVILSLFVGSKWHDVVPARSEWVIFVANQQCASVSAVESQCMQHQQACSMQHFSKQASCKEHDAVVASMSWLPPLITLGFCPTFCPGVQGDVLFNQATGCCWQKRRGEIKQWLHRCLQLLHTWAPRREERIGWIVAHLLLALPYHTMFCCLHHTIQHWLMLLSVWWLPI